MAKQEPTLKFKSDSDKLLALDEFEGLKNHPGWKRIVKFYSQKVEFLEELLAEGEIEDIPHLKLVRTRRNMSLQFINLPDIIQELMNDTEKNEVDLDPYEK